MRTWALVIGCAVGAFSLAACSGSSTTGTSTSSGGSTTGATTTGGSTTSTTSSSTGGTTTGGTTTSATTSGGSTSGGSTTGGSTTTGGTTGSGSTSGGSSTGGTTTGGAAYDAGPPYQGVDSGPISEPPIYGNCTAATPFQNPGGPYAYPYCVQCRTSADCASGLHCDTSYQCVTCRDNGDCPMGEICQSGCVYTNTPPYYSCQDACLMDCRSPDAGKDYCNPGLCDGDAGGCLSNECTANWQCQVNGGGACDFQLTSAHGYGTCQACTADAGGCGPNEFCVSNFGQNACQLSCLVDAGVCGPGTYCNDGGICTTGCQSSADCTGSYQGNICHQGQCSGCLKNADCPDYNSGCNPEYQGGQPTCGYCKSDDDCNGLHCETNQTYSYYSNQCGCHSDLECPLDAPVCLGLNADAGFPAGSGRCGCSDTSQCPSYPVPYVCETRYPFTIFGNNVGGPFQGGACIAPCNLDVSGTSVTPTDCATAGIGPSPSKYYPNGPPPGDNVCNSATGYCVSCAQSSDCYQSPTGPWVAPACVLYANGTDPASGEPTGGGQCGCSDTLQCNDNYACWNPGVNGTCQPACTIVNGVDSCNPLRPYYYPPPTDPFCNTWTGACVQCLDSYGCTNVTTYYVNGIYTYPPLAASLCNSAGQCVGCSTDADCPASEPNCTQGFCGFCTKSSDCYGDAGFTCVQFEGTGNGGQCLVTGCVPDSSEYPTDAGTPCPAGLPYCAGTYSYAGGYKAFDICATCRLDYQQPNYTYYGDCMNTLPPGAYYGYCQQNGTCYYY